MTWLRWALRNRQRDRCQCGHRRLDHYQALDPPACLHCECTAFLLTHKPPAPDSGPTPRGRATADPPLRPLAPGHIPPPPAIHRCGGVVRLVDIRANGCIWIWRRGHGWQQAAVCIPSDSDWDDWLAALPLEDK